MFQIVRLTPIYHFSTDAYLGKRVAERSHGYLTLALAHKIASIRAQADYEDYGDDSFVVVPFGGSPFTDEIFDPALASTADIPF